MWGLRTETACPPRVARLSLTAVGSPRGTQIPLRRCRKCRRPGTKPRAVLSAGCGLGQVRGPPRTSLRSWFSKGRRPRPWDGVNRGVCGSRQRPGRRGPRAEGTLPSAPRLAARRGREQCQPPHAHSGDATLQPAPCGRELTWPGHMACSWGLCPSRQSLAGGAQLCPLAGSLVVTPAFFASCGRRCFCECSRGDSGFTA